MDSIGFEVSDMKELIKIERELIQKKQNYSLCT